MKVKLHFNPPQSAIGQQGKYEFCVEFKYNMFPELSDEFNAGDYPSLLIPLQEELDENDNPEYVAEFDRPYGTYTANLKWRVKDAAEGDENGELKALPEGLDEKYFAATHEPKPISEQQQKLMDEEEEKQNKKKEQDARLAQKELESKKAQQKVEAQMQLLKQEQNSAKLKVYFSVMNLYFHKVSAISGKIYKMWCVSARRGLQCFDVVVIDIPSGAL